MITQTIVTEFSILGPRRARVKCCDTCLVLRPTHNRLFKKFDTVLKNRYTLRTDM
jgi:hypothetical protein